MAPFKIFTDKASDFECKIEIDGAPLSEATARLILSHEKKSVLYEGTITDQGKCKIDIPHTRGIFEQDDVGSMFLEVIVEGISYFRPWEGKFEVDTYRKVRVTPVTEGAKTPPQKPQMRVVVKEQITPYQTKIVSAATFLRKNGITTPRELLRNKQLVREVIMRVFVNESVGRNTVIADLVQRMSL